jgi:NitT/TauT family transport system substrate-binding protein
MEGFDNVEYVDSGSELRETPTDLGLWGVPGALRMIDDGLEMRVLSGIHVGCWELFGNDNVQAVRDLRGKTIGAASVRSIERIWISTILAYVGINPHSEVNWVETGSLAESQRQFIAGKLDAFLAFPPQPQEMRLLKQGHVLVNTTTDKPWSQYFCCMLLAHHEFERKYPVATKRALRAMLKAADICARKPQEAARFLGVKGYEKRFDLAVEVLSQLPYGNWRDWSHDDTLRFHALRLKEVGLIKSTPNELVARSADWRFLNELKRELKA